jgi:hypothetical protein
VTYLEGNDNVPARAQAFIKGFLSNEGAGAGGKDKKAAKALLLAQASKRHDALSKEICRILGEK